MIRVTVELLPKGNEEKKRRLGVIEIWNDKTGSENVGNYKGVLRAEYTGKDGREGAVRGFRRKRQSVFTLIGQFLRQWGHVR